ncbi:MAG: class I mannose-6-phosphate isomerase [Trueperaceae bacterium]|nr:class I mannose-6-phosphate isomerase [Trueperaceae bacterium]
MSEQRAEQRPALGMLRVAPTFHQRIWGADRLWEFHGATPPARPADGHVPIGESWLLDPASTVASGPHAGERFSDLAARFGADLVGTVSAARYGARLPLLAKFLDTSQALSIQVHPNDAQALAFEPTSGHLGKAEAWYLLEVDQGASLVWGFARGVSADEVRRGAEDGSLLGMLNHVTVSAGDIVVNPAGLVHAVGAGMLLFEIQQASDITYRLYDFGRAGPDGKPRELHLDKALAVSSFSPSGTPPPAPARVPGQWVDLVEMEQFSLQRLELLPGAVYRQATSELSMELLVVSAGSATVSAGDQVEHLNRGDALLLPATLGTYELRGSGETLRCAVVRPRTAP